MFRVRRLVAANTVGQDNNPGRSAVFTHVHFTSASVPYLLSPLSDHLKWVVLCVRLCGALRVIATRNGAFERSWGFARRSPQAVLLYVLLCPARSRSAFRVHAAEYLTP
jgi:hypothetical protein